MYVYVYDEFTNQKKYSKLLYKIENRLTDLGLNGWSVKSGVSKNLQTALDNKIQQGAKTIVAIGDDKTVSQIINIIANSKSDDKHRLTLGIIPVGKGNNTMAKMFGINNIDDACKILLARRIESFTLGQVNENYFLFNVALPPALAAIIEINNSYTIQGSTPFSTVILNNPQTNPPAGGNKQPLKVHISNKEGESYLEAVSVFITSNKTPIIIDGALEIKNSALIKPGSKTIKIIISKNRSPKI